MQMYFHLHRAPLPSPADEPFEEDVPGPQPLPDQEPVPDHHPELSRY